MYLSSVQILHMNNNLYQRMKKNKWPLGRQNLFFGTLLSLCSMTLVTGGKGPLLVEELLVDTRDPVHEFLHG